MKFENVDVIDALRRIMDIHTEHYKSDFMLDEQLIRRMADSENPEDKHILWMSRPNSTQFMREREVYIKDTHESKTWAFYHEQMHDPILAYAVEITGVKNGSVMGNVVELDYAAHAVRAKELSVTVDKLAVTFEDQSTFYLPFRTYRKEIAAMQGDHGAVHSVAFLPESERELQMVLSRERFTANRQKTGDIDSYIQRIAVQHGKPEMEASRASIRDRLKEPPRSQQDKQSNKTKQKGRDMEL